MEVSTTKSSNPGRTRAWNAAMSAHHGDLDLIVPAEKITGTIPASLRGGRMLSNGPGWTVIGGRIAHPFDGHGYVRSFHLLEDGTCRFRARYVETPSYIAERTAQRLVHRGLATNLGGGWFRNLGFGATRNVANTTITPWGDRLLAGWEGGVPYAVHRDSLETVGPHTFGGLLENRATLAHMHKDQANQRLIMCSLGSIRDPAITFREVDDEEKLVATRKAKIPGPFFMHDFAFTPNWYVLGGNPLRVRPKELFRMAVGSSTMLRSIAAKTDVPGVLYLVSRKDGETIRAVRLPKPSFFVHFANAFERDGNIIVDACLFHEVEFGEEFGYQGPDAPFDPALPDKRNPQRLYRMTITPGSDEATWELISPYGIDFPRIGPDDEGRESPVIFGACRSDPRFSDPFDSIVRISTREAGYPSQLWTAAPNVFVGEPIFVPAENEGYVLAILSAALDERSQLAIFNSENLAAGPIALIPVPLLPIAFHGAWMPAQA